MERFVRDEVIHSGRNQKIFSKLEYRNYTFDLKRPLDAFCTNRFTMYTERVKKKKFWYKDLLWNYLLITNYWEAA